MEEMAQINAAIMRSLHCCGPEAPRLSVQTSRWTLSAWDPALEICHYDVECTNTSARELENVRNLKHSKHVSLALGVFLETFEEVFSVVSAHSENASSRNTNQCQV
jgi:hypothetical protein